MTQDVGVVHLLDEHGEPLCDAAPSDVTAGVDAADWASGQTPATVAARACRACMEKAT